jgi:hypothetical protein
MHEKSTKFAENCKLKIAFTSKQMTAYGGTFIISKLFEKLKTPEFIERAWPKQETSNNSKGIYAKVLVFWLSILAGGERFSHIMFLSHSLEVLAKTFALKELPTSASALTRFIGKFKRQVSVDAFRNSLWEYMSTWIPWKKIGSDWIDTDSTVIERYGNQEGAEKGYNPKKPGRASHHPLVSFLGNKDYCLNLWNRSGNTHSANNLINFLTETYGKIKGKITIIGFRLDSGFYDEKIINFILSLGQHFIISAKLYSPLKRILLARTDWIAVEEGIFVTSFMYKPSTWEKEYLHVAIRQDTGIRGKATGKQLNLFENETNEKYRYSVMVTDFNKDAKSIWDDYKPRANCENRISESKEDFALSGFSLKSFWATEMAMLLRMLLFNMFVYFRTEILETPRVRLKTIRPKFFIIPGIMGRNGKTELLRLGVKNRSFREKLRTVISLISKLNPFEQINCNAVEGVL